MSNDKTMLLSVFDLVWATLQVLVNPVSFVAHQSAAALLGSPGRTLSKYVHVTRAAQ